MNENQNEYVDINVHDNYPDSVQKVEIPTMKVIPLKKICMTIGEIPSSYLETMTYYEMLVWFIEYLKNNIIPTINNNAEAVQEVQTLVLELQNYINDFKDSIDEDVEGLEEYMNNYFENLDVQEEINNKLDDMLEDGVLEQIIEQFLQLTSLICFDNVADMKSSVNLANGSYAKTLGYYSINDGGSATYKVRTITNDDVVDEASIIALNDDTLIAELIASNSLNIKVFGVKEDDSTDDSDNIQKAFNFIKNHNEITIKGNKSFCKITKTLDVPVYSRIKDIYFNMYEGSYTNNYLMYVNSNTTHNNWLITYPTYDGFIKNCKFKNNTNNNYNGIYNYSNSTFKELIFDNFNVAIKVASNYLDSYKLNRITSINKIGTDYSIDLGYLGDQVDINTLHLQGEGNQLNVGSGHNGIIINNVIAHGVINVNGSIVTFNNLHQEGGSSKIVINNSIASINNAYIYHNRNLNEHNIEITNSSFVTLKNIKFNYRLNSSDITDNSNDDIDINISSNSKCKVINCFKRVLVTDIAENNFCIAKTNISLSLNNEQEYTTKNYQITNYETDQKYEAHGGYYSGTSSKVLWKIPSGTYYYVFQPIADFNRMIRYSSYVRNYNASLTQNGNGYTANLDFGKYRVYRGTSDGSYDKYVDICFSGGSIYDDGLSLSGNLWKSREAGAVDSFNDITQIMYEGNTIRYFQTAVPTIGSWNRGDIIYNSNSGSVGWICTTAGSPGTWKEI